MKTVWKDRLVERPNTFEVQENPDGTITLIPTPGTVTQAGTPVNATNLNKIEDGIVTLENNVTTHLADNVSDADGAHGLIVNSGTWTPSFGGSTVLGTANYTHRQGSYMRVGNIVYIAASVRITSLTGGSGYFTISGLPFTPSNRVSKYFINIAQTVVASIDNIADVYTNKIWFRSGSGSAAVEYANISSQRDVEVSGIYMID